MRVAGALTVFVVLIFLAGEAAATRDERWHLVDPAAGPVQNSKDLLLWQTLTPSVLDVLGGTRSRSSSATRCGTGTTTGDAWR